MQTEEKRVLKDVLGNELWTKVMEDSVDGGMFLHLYHETGRDQEHFVELVEKYFEAVKLFDEAIDNYRELIEQHQEMKKGFLQDIQDLPDKETLLKTLEEELEED